MEPSHLARKIGRPTIQMATLALALDLFSILTIGKSPAYVDLSAISSSVPISIGYLAMIAVLVVFPAIIPLYGACVALNELVYRLVSWPFRCCRFFRVLRKFQRRRDFFDIEKVHQYAMKTRNDDLLERIANHRKAHSSPQHLVPVLSMAFLITVLLVSDEQKPNFLMKVCSLEEPVSMCDWYVAVVALAFLQITLLMALNGASFRSGFFFPKRLLNVADEEVRDYRYSNSDNDFDAARVKWLKGRK